MGKKRVVKTGEETGAEGRPKSVVAPVTVSRKKLAGGLLHIQATYNNTKLSLADSGGNVVAWSSSGALGFRGAKKGTTFAAGKVGELLADKAQNLGMKEVDVIIKGIGSGRESALRAFISRGVNIGSIRDATPLPFNGPKPKKPRRV